MRKRTKSGPKNMTDEDFATADDAAKTTLLGLTDKEILQKATLTENDEVEKIEDEDKELVPLSKRSVENSLKTFKKLFLFSEIKGDQMQDLINRFETLLMRNKVEKCK